MLDPEYIQARDEALRSASALHHRLFTIHDARAKRYSDAGNAEGATRERWCAQAFLALQVTADGVFALRDDAVLDRDGVWSKAPGHVYEHFYVRGTAADEPAPIRVVFLHALWELRRVWGGLKPAIVPSWKIGVAAVEAHLKAAEHWSASSRDASFVVCVVDHLRTAVGLAETMNNDDLLEKALAISRTESASLFATDLGWCLRLLEIELSVAGRRRIRKRLFVDETRLQEIERALIELELRLAADAIPGLHEAALEARFNVETLLGRPPKTEERAARLGRLARARAEAQAEPMLAVSYWKSAAEHFQRAGLEEEELHASNAARRAVVAATQRFESVPFDVAIDRDLVQRLIADVSSASSVREALQRVASDLFMAPVDMPRPRGISDLIPLENFVGDRSLGAHDPGSEADRRARLIGDLKFELSVFNAGYLLPVIQHLRDSGGLTAHDVVAFVSASNAIEADELPLLFLGVRSFLREEHVVALHMLVPRLENLIRGWMRVAGVNVTRLENGGMQEVLLGGLLSEGENRGVIERNLAWLLRVTLTEETGFNVRNRVAHGWARAPELNAVSAARIVHLILVVSARERMMALERVRGREAEPPADR